VINKSLQSQLLRLSPANIVYSLQRPCARQIFGSLKNMQTMDNKTLKDMSLCVLDVEDMCNTHGGSLIDFATTTIKKLTPAAFTIWVIDNWDEVKKGFSDGWNVK
jgi:hypothetical protein